MYALTGVLAVPYLLAASYLAPKIGVGLFLGALITGQLAGGVVLDHLGAFGAAVRPVDAIRVLGIAALLAGVVLGGMTKLVSATLGGFAIGFASGLLGGALPTEQSQYLPSFLFAAVILVLLVRPGGLFARGGTAVERV